MKTWGWVIFDYHILIYLFELSLKDSISNKNCKHKEQTVEVRFEKNKFVSILPQHALPKSRRLTSPAPIMPNKPVVC
jgi:hypothetical protein